MVWCGIEESPGFEALANILEPSVSSEEQRVC